MRDGQRTSASIIIGASALAGPDDCNWVRRCGLGSGLAKGGLVGGREDALGPEAVEASEAGCEAGTVVER